MGAPACCFCARASLISRALLVDFARLLHRFRDTCHASSLSFCRSVCRGRRRVSPIRPAIPLLCSGKGNGFFVTRSVFFVNFFETVAFFSHTSRFGASRPSVSWSRKSLCLSFLISIRLLRRAVSCAPSFSRIPAAGCLLAPRRRKNRPAVMRWSVGRVVKIDTRGGKSVTPARKCTIFVRAERFYPLLSRFYPPRPPQIPTFATRKRL